MAMDSLAGLGILVVEDEPLLRKQLAASLEKLGPDVTGAGTLSAARQLLADLSFDFALVDVNLPDGRGPDLLQEKVFPSQTGVIIMTANGAVAGAVEAMRLGALDYLMKPFDPLELPLVIGRARRAKQTSRAEEHRREEQDNLTVAVSGDWVGCRGLRLGTLPHHRTCGFPHTAVERGGLVTRRPQGLMA